MSIEVVQQTQQPTLVQSENKVDIIKKYNNIKKNLEQIKSRLFIHEFTSDNTGEIYM